jgi:hypothetical protein
MGLHDHRLHIPAASKLLDRSDERFVCQYGERELVLAVLVQARVGWLESRYRLRSLDAPSAGPPLFCRNWKINTTVRGVMQEGN